MNYENDINIDDTALDVEWVEQANLMLKYSKYSAEKRKELEEAKERLELTKAELGLKIRTNPDDYGITKITEASVEGAIIAHEDYQSDSEALIQAKFEVDVAYGAVRAVEARKDALENLVKLLGMQYFAGPQEPRDLHAQREIKTKRINEIIGNKIISRRK